jgi:hypothetical protein
MINVVMLFILSAIGFGIRLLCLLTNPEQTEMRNLNLCGTQSKIAGSQYRKNFTIWELGKNKFT